MRDDRFRNPWAAVGVVAFLAALAGVGFVLASAEPPAASLPSAEELEAEEAPERPRSLPLEAAERLVVMGRHEACVVAGTEAACTRDGGGEWEAMGPLPAPVIAAAYLEKGRFAFVCLDGRIYEASAAMEPEAILALPGEYAVVDAASRDGTLILLAQRYDEPEDPMERLPRVVETTILEVEGGRTWRKAGSLAGFGGDRLLLQREGLITFASVDQRAWRSRDGGRSFARLPDRQRFGMDFGGLSATVERRAERLPGPGRPARPASSLWISRDGERWEQTLETAGELLVDFSDGPWGMAIARGEGIAWITVDEGKSFDALVHDERLDDAVDVGWLGGRFVVVTRSAGLLYFAPDSFNR